MSIRDSIRTISPSWLAGGVAEKLMYLCGVVLDGFVQSLNEGLLARMPGHGTPTALGYIGDDRQIERGAGETNEAYADRLAGAFDTWRGAGRPRTKLEQIRSYVTPQTPVMRQVSNNSIWDTIDAAGAWVRKYASPKNWAWDGGAGIGGVVPAQWFRTWIVIYPPPGLWQTEGTWGDPGTFGDGGTWGTTATPSQVADVRRLCQKWKAQHSVIQWIIIAFDATSFDPSKPFGDPGLPDGNWEHWGKLSGGDYVAARLSSARYWDGVI